MSTIALPQDTLKELKLLQIEKGYRSMKDVVEDLLLEYKRSKFLAASENFKQRMKKRGIKIEELVK
ncbi:MAG: hypothetical protein WC974_06325 [Thermoplasmata archaeon]